MDYAIEHALNHAIREHGLLVSVISGFANWGVIAFGVAICALWLLDPPREPGRWRRAAAAGLSAAAVGLLASQAISHVWDRPRPYQDHPHGVIPLLAPSLDPSFPSDHATAAFAIAFGVFFVVRRAGWLFLAWASLISLSRALAGMHYPTDLMAGMLIGLGSGYLTARVAMPLLWRIIVPLSRLTDPVLGAAAQLRPVRELIASPSLRRTLVGAAGGVMLALFAYRMRGHVLDEMPLATLAIWTGVVALAVRGAGLPSG